MCSRVEFHFRQTTLRDMITVGLLVMGECCQSKADRAGLRSVVDSISSRESIELDVMNNDPHHRNAKHEQYFFIAEVTP